LGTLFRFVPLPPAFLAILGVVLVGYLAGAEAAKALFYRYHPRA
jgi:Mg2+-importing ATPase